MKMSNKKLSYCYCFIFLFLVICYEPQSLSPVQKCPILNFKVWVRNYFEFWAFTALIRMLSGNDAVISHVCVCVSRLWSGNSQCPSIILWGICLQPIREKPYRLNSECSRRPEVTMQWPASDRYHVFPLIHCIQQKLSFKSRIDLALASWFHETKHKMFWQTQIQI